MFFVVALVIFHLYILLQCHISGFRFFVFFFFKQKTAYEMRISDWSSDVCSSDLLASVAVALSQDDVPAVWIPSGSRACQITMRDGRPLGLLLSEADSDTLRESDVEPLPRSGRMRQVSPKGTGVLTVGTVLFLAGLASLTVAAGFHFLSASMIASAPLGGAQLVDAMPHRQWPLVDRRPQRDMHAAALRLQNGHWIVDWVASPVAPQENTPSGTAPLPDDAIIGPSSPETEMPEDRKSTRLNSSH